MTAIYGFAGLPLRFDSAQETESNCERLDITGITVSEEQQSGLRILARDEGPGLQQRIKTFDGIDSACKQKSGKRRFPHRILTRTPRRTEPVGDDSYLLLADTQAFNLLGFMGTDCMETGGLRCKPVTDREIENPFQRSLPDGAR